MEKYRINQCVIRHKMKLICMAFLWMLLVCFFTETNSKMIFVKAAEIQLSGSETKIIQSGVVDIHLKQYHIEKDQLVEGTSNTVLLPGEWYSMVPIVYNDGADSYIRIKIDVQVISDGVMLENAMLSVDHLTGLSRDWIVKDSYMYYKNILHHNEAVQILDGIQIPTFWEEEYAGAKVNVVVTAEAVQSSAFSPDFQEEEPWGGFVAETTKKDSYDWERLETTEQKGIVIEIDSKAKSLIICPDGFLSNYTTLMPGGSVSDNIKIQNRSESQKELYLTIQTASDSVLLLPQLNLSISEQKEDGTTKQIYNGQYTGDDIQKGIKLGSFSKGESGTLVFSISMPSGLGNNYSLLSEESLWTFSVKESQEEWVEKTSEPKASVVGKMVRSIAAKTGDAEKLLVWSIGLGLSLGVMVAVLFKERKCQK